MADDSTLQPEDDIERASASSVIGAACGYARRALPASVGKHPADVVMVVADVLHAWLVAHGYESPQSLLSAHAEPVSARMTGRMPAPQPTTSRRTDAMTAQTTRFDDRTLDRDPERARVSAEHYIDVVRNTVRARLLIDEDPATAMLDGFTAIEWWLTAVGEVGFEPAGVLVGQLYDLLDVLAAKRTPAEQLAWLRTPADVLDGVTPVEAIVRHRIRAVLALARSLPDAPADTDTGGDGRDDADTPLDGGASTGEDDDR